MHSLGFAAVTEMSSLPPRNGTLVPARIDPPRLDQAAQAVLPMLAMAKNDPISDPAPFWRTKRLAEMTTAEWESLCDGCGRCCLNKLEEEDSGRIYFTDVGCKLLDADTCRCTDYARRSDKVADCVRLTAQNVPRIAWLPPTCAYRLVAEGRDLYWWHPLVSGDPDTVHAAGVSVRGKVPLSEEHVPDDQLEDHIVSWPARVPKGARKKPAG